MARDADEVPASGGGDCPQIGPRRATKQGIFKTRQILMSFAPPGITLPTIPQSEISNQNSQRNRKSRCRVDSIRYHTFDAGEIKIGVVGQ